MKTLQYTLESLLDAGFDITDDDVRPLKLFCQNHKAKWNRPTLAGNNINGEFLDIILSYGYGKLIGGPDDVDWDDFLQDVAKSGDSIMAWQPNINLVEIYTCDRPRRGKDSLRWTMHSQNLRISGATWAGPNEPNYRDEGIKSMPWNNTRTASGKATKIVRLNKRVALDEMLDGLK